MQTSSLMLGVRLTGKYSVKQVVGAIAILVACGSAHAQQGQSMEERLRAQLRNTTEQLQQAQNELAVLRGGGRVASSNMVASAPADVATLQKELDKAKAAEKSAQSRSSRADKENRDIAEKANTQIAQYKNAYEELLRLARASDTERQRLAGQEKFQQTALAQCEVKNVKLYEAGQEILNAYETLDITDVIASRQPFSAKSRTKFEQIAQSYGDKLYEGKFDTRAVKIPVAPPAVNANASTFTATVDEPVAK